MSSISLNWLFNSTSEAQNPKYTSIMTVISGLGKRVLIKVHAYQGKVLTRYLLIKVIKEECQYWKVLINTKQTLFTNQTPC